MHWSAARMIILRIADIGVGVDSFLLVCYYRVGTRAMVHIDHSLRYVMLYARRENS